MDTLVFLVAIEHLGLVRIAAITLVTGLSGRAHASTVDAVVAVSSASAAVATGILMLSWYRRRGTPRTASGLLVAALIAPLGAVAGAYYGALATLSSTKLTAACFTAPPAAFTGACVPYLLILLVLRRNSVLGTR
jgi:hypothetical protein